MSKTSSRNTRIWLDGIDISGYLNASDQDIKQANFNTETFTDTGPRLVTDLWETQFKIGGFFDAATLALDPDAFALLGSSSDHTLTLSYGAAAEGSAAYTAAVQMASDVIASKVGQATLLNLDMLESATLARGQLLRSATLTGAGNGSAMDMLTSFASGRKKAIHFHLFSFSGTSVTLKLQDSANGTTGWNDVSGVTSGALTSRGSVRVTTTALTARYWRIVASGTFSSAAVGVAGGLVAQQ